MISRQKSLSLLNECTGETLWPVEMCLEKGVPQPWVESLANSFESGFDQDRDTIYLNELNYQNRQATNQFYGIRDVDLAVRLGQELGIDVQRLKTITLGRSALVDAIKEAIMDGE